MHILDNNIKLITDTLLSRLNSVTPVDIEWRMSRDGLEIPVCNGVPLHSTYSAAREAQRQAAAVAADCDVVIAAGVGAGYHLTELCRDKFVIAVPLDCALFASIVSHIDMSGYLHNIVFCDESELYQQLYSLYARHSEAKVAVTVSSYCLAHNRQASDRVCRAAAAALSSAKTETATIRRFGIVWHNNIRKNVSRCFDGGYDMSPLFIRDRIILVAGAGYSLTQHIGFIRDNRSRFYIASADTAAAVLIRSGIVPDSVWTFDAQYISMQHFLCLHDTSMPVRIFADFCSPIYISTRNATTTPVFSSHPYRRILETAGWTLRDIDSVCGNIGAAAAHFFRRYFPDASLVTVGIDFAYYNGYAYAAGSYLDEYRMTRQDYLHTAQLCDACITYRDRCAGENNGWRTTPLMLGYAAAADSGIMTISGSPYCGMHHITPEQALELRASGEYCLDMDLHCGPQNEFRRTERSYLDRDRTPLLPLEMAKEMRGNNNVNR